MKLLDEYFDLQKRVHEYFGYVEDWVVIPLDDATEFYWLLKQKPEGWGSVRYAINKESLLRNDGDYYENQIYTQRFLPKWVYEGEEYTMVCVDTQVDGNKFLQVFDNSKRIT